MSEMKFMGRPPIIKSADEMEKRCEEYFNSLMDEDGKRFLRPPTIAGLALWLGMETRTLLRYGEKDDFCPIVLRAKQQVEAFTEEQAFTSKSKNPISLLGMNYGRVEKTKVEVEDVTGLADKILAARKRGGITPNE